jgi:hypothetical protein
VTPLRRAGTVALWWILGCIAALALATLRAAAPESAAPYLESIDLERDIGWFAAHMPAEAKAFIDEPGGERTGWRISGMHVLERRFGEERAILTAYRRDADGRLARVPSNRIRAERLRRGIPFPCLEGDVWTLGSGLVVEASVWRIPRPGAPTIDLPLRVLWLGVAANGALTGLFLWMLARLPAAAEAAVRRRRGQCPRCAHPLIGASRCPECGWDAPASR